MKTKFTHTKIAGNTKMYVLCGAYDENGLYYEKYADDMLFCDLPEFVRDEISPSHDTSVLIFPRERFFAFSEQASANVIAPRNAAIMRWLFESYGNYDNLDDCMLWTAVNFNE